PDATQRTAARASPRHHLQGGRAGVQPIPRRPRRLDSNLADPERAEERAATEPARPRPRGRNRRPNADPSPRRHGGGRTRPATAPYARPARSPGRPDPQRQRAPLPPTQGGDQLQPTTTNRPYQ